MKAYIFLLGILVTYQYVNCANLQIKKRKFKFIDECTMDIGKGPYQYL